MPSEDRQRLLTGNLTLLMALEANGMDRPAGQLVEKIGAGLARRPKPTLATVAGKIELPDDQRGRSEFDIKELDRINARLMANSYRASGGVTATEKREADLGRRDELEKRPQTRADQQWQRAAVAETADLAKARGEEVAEDKAGVKRILDRDPLLSLARAGHLTPDQLETGLEVRLLYERRAEDAGASEYTGMPGGGMRDHVGAGLTRAKAMIGVGQIEMAIRVGHYRSVSGTLCIVRAFERFKVEGVSPEVAMTILRAVCERNLSMASQGKGRGFERNVVAFALALDVADAVLKRRL